MCTANRECDEGLPLLLFAVRETNQKPLGFSPTDCFWPHYTWTIASVKRKIPLGQVKFQREHT